MKRLTKKAFLDQVARAVNFPLFDSMDTETLHEDRETAQGLLEVAYKCDELKIEHLRKALLFSQFFMTSQNQLIHDARNGHELMYGAAAVMLYNAISISGGIFQIPENIEKIVNAKYGHLSEYRKIA